MKRSNLAACLALLFVLPAIGAEVGVWSDPFLLKYTSIQEAVSNAADGNTIRMETNVFFENVVVSNKDLVFEGGYDSNLVNRVGGYTAIDGSSAGVPLYFFASSSRVDAVNLVHGAGIWGGGCLLKENSWVEFTNSCMSSNACIFAGGGLYVDGGSYAKLIGRSAVFSNVAMSAGVGAWGGGIFVESSGRVDLVHEDADVFDNVVIDGNGGGIYVGDLGHLRLFQADVFGNTAVSGPVSIVSAGGGIGASGAFIETGDGAEVFGNRADWGGGLAMILCTANLGRVYSHNFFVHDNAATQGGGLYAISSRISASGTVWSANRAEVNGGGVYMSDSVCHGYGSLFESNVAAASGGGMFATESSPNLSDTTFQANRAGDNGGGMCNTGCQTYLYDCRFIGNAATNSGGGLRDTAGTHLGIFGTAPPFYAPPDDWTVLFRENLAGWGGALDIVNTPAMIQHAAIISNRSHMTPISASGSYSASPFSMPHLDMSACLVAGNYAQSALGILVLDLNATGTVVGCTVADNDGIGIEVGDLGATRMAISNCVIWGNDQSISNGGTLTVDYSNVQDGWPGTGNMDQNPKLLANYHLRGDSPCINAGSPASGADYDIDGEQRAGDFDMGCDEFIDGDGDGLANVVETGTGVWISDIDTGSDPGNAHSDADTIPDGDEWIADTDPNDPDSFLGFVDMWADTPAPAVKWKGGANAIQCLEICEDLRNGAWGVILTNLPPTSITNEYGLPTFPAAAFRIRAQR